MNKLFKSFMTIAAFSALTIVSSCTKTCDEGFEGDKCDTEIRAKFIDNYDVSESKNSNAPYSYTTSITTSSANVLQVNISELGGNFFNSSVKATVDGTSLTIASQDPDSDGYTIAGSGTISNNTVSLTYTITGEDGGGSVVTDNYSATLTPQ